MDIVVGEIVHESDASASRDVWMHDLPKHSICICASVLIVVVVCQCKSVSSSG